VGISYSSTSQETEPKQKKWYTTRGGDAGLISFSNVSMNGVNLNNVPRFTFFLNSGTNFNTDLSKHVGFFTGYSAKNIGVIYDESATVRYKRRVIALGVPVGFKFGNMKRGQFFYLGAQADLALNYKEKRFEDGKKVSKNNEWFSKKSDLFIPSVFAGFRTTRKVGMKVQYFPNNFFNQEYEKDGIRPFAGMEATMFFITLSYDFSVRDIQSKLMKE
jgi:hypothetical protein